MKRFCSAVTLTVLLLSVVLAAGCSSAAPAGQTVTGTMQPSATADSVPTPVASQAATQAPTPTASPAASPVADQTEDPNAAASGWKDVLEVTITHAANMVGFYNKEFGVTVGYGGEIHYTNDGGKTWPKAENSSACRFCLDIISDQLIWSGGNGKNVRVSHDGGKTWTAVTDIDLGTIHSNIAFVDDKTGWIATSFKLAATADGGKTWKEMPLPEGAVGIAAIGLRTANDGYLMSLNGLLFTTADGGATWSKQDLGFEKNKIFDLKNKPGLNKATIALADISFTDKSNGTIAFVGLTPGEGYHIWCMTTADGGTTWKSEILPKTSFLPSKVFLSRDGKYLTVCSNTNQTVVFERK